MSVEKYKIHPSFFIFQLIISESSLNSIIREQYELSRRANISIDISNEIPDFEREIYVNLLIKDLQDEAEIEKKRWSVNK